MLKPLLVGWLVFTLPSTGQHSWVDPSQGADSMMVECNGAEQIHQLLTARLYGWPVTGGGPRLVAEHSAVGREGRPDSFQVPWPGLFYVTATNPKGESCASATVTVAPPDLTGVGTADQPLDELVGCTLFDVRGRRVGSFPGRLWRLHALTERDLRAGTPQRLPSGVYWLRGATRGGRVVMRRVVIVR